MLFPFSWWTLSPSYAFAELIALPKCHLLAGGLLLEQGCGISPLPFHSLEKGNGPQVALGLASVRGQGLVTTI